VVAAGVPGRRIGRRSLAGDVLGIAPALLGFVVEHRTEDGVVAVRLTEVEAYAGLDDPASHAFRGPTARTRVMFGPPGRLYVYFSYGMHWCANVVCGPDGTASAVLLRAGEVVRGAALATARRPACRRSVDLARGPARLCSALGIGGEHDGIDLLARASPIRLLAPSTAVDAGRIGTGPRVGIRAAADRPWRYFLDGEETVSAYRPIADRRATGAGIADAIRQTGHRDRSR